MPYRSSWGRHRHLGDKDKGNRNWWLWGNQGQSWSLQTKSPNSVAPDCTCSSPNASNQLSPLNWFLGQEEWSRDPKASSCPQVSPLPYPSWNDRWGNRPEQRSNTASPADGVEWSEREGMLEVGEILCLEREARRGGEHGFAFPEMPHALRLEDCWWKHHRLAAKDCLLSASCFDNLPTQSEQDHGLSKIKALLFLIRDADNVVATG